MCFPDPFQRIHIQTHTSHHIQTHVLSPRSFHKAKEVHVGHWTLFSLKIISITIFATIPHRYIKPDRRTPQGRGNTLIGKYGAFREHGDTGHRHIHRQGGPSNTLRCSRKKKHLIKVLTFWRVPCEIGSELTLQGTKDGAR